MMVGGRRPVDKYLGREARQQQPHPALRAQIFQLSINIFPHCELVSTADATKARKRRAKKDNLEKEVYSSSTNFLYIKCHSLYFLLPRSQSKKLKCDSVGYVI